MVVIQGNLLLYPYGPVKSVKSSTWTRNAHLVVTEPRHRHLALDVLPEGKPADRPRPLPGPFPVHPVGITGQEVPDLLVQNLFPQSDQRRKGGKHRRRFPPYARSET